MNFMRNSRGTERDDYLQFSKFLGLDRRNPRREENDEIPSNSDTLPCKNETPLAMVYPVKQGWCGIYDPEVALLYGTIFEELNKPFNFASCGKRPNDTEGCL